MSKYNTDCYETMKSITDIFPIEVDLPSTILLQREQSQDQNDAEDEDDQIISLNQDKNIVKDLIGIDD